jgi:hypothetical protein
MQKMNGAQLASCWTSCWASLGIALVVLSFTLRLPKASAHKLYSFLVDFDNDAFRHNATFYTSNDSAFGGISTMHGWRFWSDPGIGMYGVVGGKVDSSYYGLPRFAKAGIDWKFPDVSEFIDGSLVIECRDDYFSPGYGGSWYVAFAAGAADPSFACSAGGERPGSRGCFKQEFTIPPPEGGADFGVARIPFSSFSDKWSVATGRHNTECGQDKDACPTAAGLREMQRIEIWAQGFAGPFHLEVNRIWVEKASGEVAALV